ncbi:hypothetical protein PHMEG_00022012 [Phytophthora megakarya]|uniref:Retrotransposon gag domain-containing protein n=1 Tax=Phytophthora megakarya TaxID=4795 RepID=A0A225VJR8_9STRA|nr:hypothetical protein PHMEG_00022012 [Phytophthora megakarya]
MITPRSDNRKARVARELEQTESTANTRPVTGRISSRRQAPAGDSSSEEGNPLYQDDDENDTTAELAGQIRELTAMEWLDPTPRFEIAQHRPLCKIAPSVRFCVRDETYTHTPPNDWRMAFHLSLRDGAGQWHRSLSRKTKRTRSLLSDKFIGYYYSQLNQSAITRYYRSKRSEKEHIRDYLNRLNANIKFEHSVREAKDHVKHFLEKRGDRDLERQLTPMQLRDIHTLEDIVSDVQKMENQVSSHSSSQSSSRRDDKSHSSSSENYGRHESRSRSQEQICSEPRHTLRVALIDTSVTNLITALQTRASLERSNEYSNDYSKDGPIDFYEGDEADRDECDSDCCSKDEIQGEDTYSDQDERPVAAANDKNVGGLLMGRSGAAASARKMTDNSQVDLVKVDLDR